MSNLAKQPRKNEGRAKKYKPVGVILQSPVSRSSVNCCSAHATASVVQEGNVIMQPDGEVDIPVRRPDGDVELKGAGEHFFFPPCSLCGGILKPNVVFFGDTIPKSRAFR